MSLIGKKAPDFKMGVVNGKGSEFSEVSLSDYSGKWLVLFFYPLDFTDVWPTEIKAFSSAVEEFNKLNAEILAVSVDSVHSHKAWVNGSLGEINYPLAADMTKSVSMDYGVLLEEEGVAYRGLFIINPEGVVEYTVVHNLDVGRNTEETLRVLKALQTGSLCPINWDEGDAHL